MKLFEKKKEAPKKQDERRYLFLQSDSFRGFKRYALNSYYEPILKSIDELKYPNPKYDKGESTEKYLYDTAGKKIEVIDRKGDNGSYLQFFIDGKHIWTMFMNDDIDIRFYNLLSAGKIEKMYILIEYKPRLTGYTNAMLKKNRKPVFEDGYSVYALIKTIDGVY